ncbi:MAG TPA: PaaX family transcriptional regulator C-terminal domain-containing protein [Pseudonocardiaceae bacterium]|nr:PaaX family transcriptional regulator C-terminal domain-containing protein [Pseudonocardiaceae bacterium]
MVRPATAGPTLSRRRELAGGSARSLLMTVLGEFVLPTDAPVWTATLVDVLAMLDVEEKSARQALARTAAEGWLESERIGRRVRWSLTPQGKRLLETGAARIYSFGTDGHDWDGRWLMILVSVPESMRDLRHRLRTRLTWAGFGTPTAGVWISPRADAEADAQRIIADLALPTAAMSFVGRYGALGDEADMVAAAWNLAEVAQRYERFIAEFADQHPSTPDAVLSAQTRLVHEWRRFPFLDPQLPRTLLPKAWIGAAAANLFTERHTQWRPVATRHFAELTSRT